MKKYLYYIYLLILFCSCEDVINVNTPTTDPRLVVDASFNVFNNKNLQVDAWVKLSLTTNYFDTEEKVINDAQVSITNLTNGTVYLFTSNGNTGFYRASNDNFLPELNNIYQLNIVYDNEVYSAKAKLIPSVPIDAISQGNGSLFKDDDTEIIVKFKDDGSRNDFYLFDLDFGEFLATEDKFYQGKNFAFSYFYADLKSGQKITIKINSLEEQFYNYMKIILKQNGKNRGSPFETVPATVRGNIINKTNSDNYALGYFNISEAYTYTISIN